MTMTSPETSTPDHNFVAADETIALSASEHESELLRSLAMEFSDTLHQEWQASWRDKHGDEPRMKVTKDAAWIKQHGENKVDIAHTSFVDLPTDYQADNLASATSAMREVLKSAAHGSTLGEDFVEAFSESVHADWLGRNGYYAGNDVKKEYEFLTEEEKEKDRVIVRKAVDIYRQWEKGTA